MVGWHPAWRKTSSAPCASQLRRACPSRRYSSAFFPKKDPWDATSHGASSRWGWVGPRPSLFRLPTRLGRAWCQADGAPRSARCARRGRRSGIGPARSPFAGGDRSCGAAEGRARVTPCVTHGLASSRPRSPRSKEKGSSSAPAPLLRTPRADLGVPHTRVVCTTHFRIASMSRMCEPRARRVPPFAEGRIAVSSPRF
jgi:hypothetical protein